MKSFREMIERITFGHLFLFNQIFLTAVLVAVVVAYGIHIANSERAALQERLDPLLSREVDRVENDFTSLENNVFKLKSFVELFESVPAATLQSTMTDFAAKSLAPYSTQYNGFFAFGPELSKKYFNRPFYVVTVHRNYALFASPRYNEASTFLTQVFLSGAFLEDSSVEWWWMNKVENKISYSDFYFDKGYMEKIMFTTATGIFSDKGKLLGVVGVDTLAGDIAHRLGLFKLGLTGGIVMANHEGRALFPLMSKESPMLGFKNRRARTEQEFRTTSHLSQLKFETSSSSLREFIGSDGEEYLTLSKPIRNRPWHLILYQKKSEAYGPLYYRLAYFAGVSFLTYLALSLLIWLSWRYVAFKNNQAFLVLKESRDKAEAATKAKSAFLSTMSHEIRTPLNAMLGVTELLSETNMDPEQSHYVRTLQGAGESLLSVLNNILDFSKIESGKTPIESVEFKLSDLLREVQDLSGAAARSKGLVFYVDNPVRDELVRGDAHRIKQVLLNLIGNAVKFTHHGEVRVSVSVQETTDFRAKSYQFMVTDTGIGIAKENLLHIFDDFRQEDSSITRRFGGTGLGLSICRKIVQLMGSDIYCESEVNKGSRFCFSLSLVGKSISFWPQKKATTSLDDNSIHVLIVDDMEDNHNLLRAYLKKAGPVTVESAFNGHECLQKVAESSFDLVFMDVQMPNLSGLDTIELMRERELSLGLKRTPVVVISANNFREDFERSLQAGADDHCGKPIRKDTILALLNKYAAKSKATVSV